MKAMTRKEVIRLLELAGFSQKSTTNHIKYVHAKGISISLSHGKEVSPGVLRQVHKAIAATK